MTHEVESRGDKTERYRRERNAARDQVDILKDKLTAKEAELKEHQEAILQTKESARRVQAAMQDKKLFIGPQALDRTIQIEFNTLFKNVRTWSRYLGGAGGATDEAGLLSLDPAVGKQFEAIAPRSDDLALASILANKSRRRYLIQGWIGLVMVENLLPTLPEAGYPGNSARDLWLDSTKAEPLWQLERALYCPAVSPREFNDWRAYSASLLSKSRKSDELPGSTTEILWQRCQQVIAIVSRWTSSEQEQADMSNELWNIFNEAVQLSQLLRVQRAQWSIRFPFAKGLTKHSTQTDDISGPEHDKGRTPLMFDRNTMKSIEPHDEDEPTDNKQVELFITPALFKRGDADGGNFDAFSIVEPSSVMWVELKGGPANRSVAVVQTMQRPELPQRPTQPIYKEPQHPQGGHQHLDVENQAKREDHPPAEHTEDLDPMEVEVEVEQVARLRRSRSTMS